MEAGAIFIAEGHFNLKPVLPLDTQEFNPQAGCAAGFNYGDYKKIELPDGKNGSRISGYYSTDRSRPVTDAQKTKAPQTH